MRFEVLIAGLLLLGNSAVMATLGNAPSNPPSPSSANAASPPVAKMLAAKPSVPSGLYTQHETELENGTSIREFSNLSGVVFAVVWRGPVLPDLSALLGDYFSTFKLETERARQSGKHSSSIAMDSAGLILSSKGRMRNFFGYAYAPSLIPPGVNINNVLQ